MLVKVTLESLQNVSRLRQVDKSEETNTLSNDEAIDKYLEMMEKREDEKDKSFGRKANLEKFFQPEEVDHFKGNFRGLVATEKDENSFEKDSVNSLKG